jgi:hypothetical protein
MNGYLRPFSCLAFAGALLLSACATSTSAPRAKTFDDKEALRAEQAMNQAEQQLDALDVENAQHQLVEARQSLKSPDLEYYPERDMLRARFRKLVSRLSAAKATKERMERELVMTRQEQRVVDALDRFETTLEPLRLASVNRAEVDRAKQAFHQTREALAEGKSLELHFPPYAKFATETEATLNQKKTDITLAEAVLAFLDGPAASKDKAQRLLGDASKASRTTRPALYKDALAQLQSCKLSGKEMLSTTPKLDRAPVLVGGQQTTPQGVTRFCEARAQVVEKRLAEATRDAQKSLARRVPPPPPRPARR